jgi:hypothetical protein
MSPSVRPLCVLLLLGACSDYELSKKGEPEPGQETGEPPVDSAEPEDPPSCEGFAPPSAPTATRDESCLREPETGDLDPVVEWNSDVLGLYSTDPHVKHPYIAPAVANLTDDNGDGRVDSDDIPDIAYTVYAGGGSADSGLRVISGDGSGEHLYIPSITWEGETLRIARQGGVALGDLEGDGSPDIVTFVGVADGSARPVAFERDGTLKWVQPDAVTSKYSYASLADLDGDGQAEVVVGQHIIDTDGTLLASGAGGTGTPASHPSPSWGSISIPMDLDGDGVREIVAGNTIYDATGATLASSGQADGFTAVADLDLDGLPEIVTSIDTTGEVYLWEADGTVTWKVATGSGGGGSPTVADFDGDGVPEIGVAGKTHYTVVEADGSVKWQTSITDFSSSATGSSVFDFDGDGASEVVFADEVSFYIFDGATGAVLFEDPTHKHGTAWEYPVVVDVDNDGAVEVVLGSVSTDASEWNGITVIGSATDSWMPARTIWNQHAYNITNVTADGGIPAAQTDNWDIWNTFRAAGQESGPAEWLSDVAPDAPWLCLETCSLDEVTLYVTLVNGGLRDEPAVEVVLLDEADAEVLRETAAPVPSGGGAVLGPFVIDRATWGSGSLRMVVDPDGLLEECDEDDNVLDIGTWPCG